MHSKQPKTVNLELCEILIYEESISLETMRNACIEFAKLFEDANHTNEILLDRYRQVCFVTKVSTF